MTKKHFILAAEIIKKIEDPVVRYSIASDFAKMFRGNNRNFKTERFFDACGIRR